MKKLLAASLLAFSMSAIADPAIGIAAGDAAYSNATSWNVAATSWSVVAIALILIGDDNDGTSTSTSTSTATATR